MVTIIASILYNLNFSINLILDLLMLLPNVLTFHLLKFCVDIIPAFVTLW